MKFSILLVSLLALTACTSVKVHKVAEGKRPKTEPRLVQQLSVEAAQARPHETLATVDMRTRSPFAANLTQLARERTAKLGGNAYSILSGNSQTTVSGGVGSLLGDSMAATMSIQVIRWSDQAHASAAKKPGLAASKPAPAEKPAAMAESGVKPKKRPWWKLWGSEKPASSSEAGEPASAPSRVAATKPAPAQPGPTEAAQPQPAKKKSWWKPWSWL